MQYAPPPRCRKHCKLSCKANIHIASSFLLLTHIGLPPVMTDSRSFESPLLHLTSVKNKKTGRFSCTGRLKMCTSQISRANCSLGPWLMSGTSYHQPEKRIKITIVTRLPICWYQIVNMLYCGADCDGLVNIASSGSVIIWLSVPEWWWLMSFALSLLKVPTCGCGGSTVKPEGFDTGGKTPICFLSCQVSLCSLRKMKKDKELKRWLKEQNIW